MKVYAIHKGDVIPFPTLENPKCHKQARGGFCQSVLWQIKVLRVEWEVAESSGEDFCVRSFYISGLGDGYIPYNKLELPWKLKRWETTVMEK